MSAPVPPAHPCVQHRSAVHGDDGGVEVPKPPAVDPPHPRLSPFQGAERSCPPPPSSMPPATVGAAGHPAQRAPSRIAAGRRRLTPCLVLAVCRLRRTAGGTGAGVPQRMPPAPHHHRRTRRTGRRRPPP